MTKIEPKLIDEDDEKSRWWVSKEPDGREIGVIATIDHKRRDITICEARGVGGEFGDVLMGFDEFDALVRLVERELEPKS